MLEISSRRTFIRHSTMSSSVISLLLFCLGSYLCQESDRNFVWEMNNIWSQCSATCGFGTRHKLLTCVRKTLYGTKELVEEERCENVKKPTTKIVTTCFYGNCPDDRTEEYVWRVTEWSTCSRSCGGNGVRTREVTCTLAQKSESPIEVPHPNCIANVEPRKTEKCASTDCPPEYVTTPWNKCTKVRVCRPGIRRRKMKCIVTLSDGKLTRISSGHCYRIGKPPIGWEFCLNDPAFQAKCKFRRDIEKKKIPIIISSHSTLHQLRRINKLRLSVGQTAYVFPHTSLVIKCPVKNFPSSSLQWIRNNSTYTYLGKTESRVSVSRRGALVIRRFLLSDKGSWKCVAKHVSSVTKLFVKSPSKGFEEWALRNIYKKENIIKIKADNQYIKTTSYQWVFSSWSRCSNTCGKDGFQNRKVNCEELASQYFVEVEEKMCADKKLQKPNNIRTCTDIEYCPQWRVLEMSSAKCSNHCVDIHTALLDTPVLCQYKDWTLPEAHCRAQHKPSPKCFNQLCEVEWQTGMWSKCSRSCGSAGISSRTIQCVWKIDNLTAGSLCYKEKLKLPTVLTTCHPAPCNLRCEDLSKYCGIRKWCRINRYRFFCCRTCNHD